MSKYIFTGPNYFKQDSIQIDFGAQYSAVLYDISSINISDFANEMFIQY